MTLTQIQLMKKKIQAPLIRIKAFIIVCGLLCNREVFYGLNIVANLIFNKFSYS